MKYHLCYRGTSTEADLYMMVVHDLKSDPFRPRYSPTRINLRRSEVYL